jgi:hypothetical protein
VTLFSVLSVRAIVESNMTKKTLDVVVGGKVGGDDKRTIGSTASGEYIINEKQIIIASVYLTMPFSLALSLSSTTSSTTMSSSAGGGGGAFFLEAGEHSAPLLATDAWNVVVAFGLVPPLRPFLLSDTRCHEVGSGVEVDRCQHR